MFYHEIVYYRETKQSLQKEWIDRGPVHRLQLVKLILPYRKYDDKLLHIAPNTFKGIVK